MPGLEHDRAGPADDERVDEAVRRLAEASASGRPCPPVRDLIGADDVDAAYAVQQRLAAQRVAAGARVVGRKIGLTSPAVQQQLGVMQPDFGVLFEDMEFLVGDTVPADAVLQPRAEAEIAFVLDEDLDDGPLDLQRVRAAIRHASPAVEICGSRVAAWDISFGDTVADNASAGAYVIGPQRVRLADVEPAEVAMELSVNGEVVSTGTGEACLGDPLLAMTWLAERARKLGDPLRAGQTILSGALGPMVALAPGDTVRATLSGLGSVSFSYGEE